MTETCTLANDCIELHVAPLCGARVTSLIDRRTGRDWLVQGALPTVAKLDVYDGAVARGWDECVPTVSPCIDPSWGGALRDHGAIWGQPTVATQTENTIRTVFTSSQFVFERTIELAGDTMSLVYRLTNHSEQTLPFLWSQHCLLQTRAGERLEITGIGAMQLGGGIGYGEALPQQFSWPYLLAAHPDLRIVEPLSAARALKTYAPVEGALAATISGPQGGLRFAWQVAEIPFLGLWLDYGGWPEDTPGHQIAIEPTTGSANDLAGAIAQDQALILAPGQSRDWRLSIQLFAPTEQGASHD